MNWCGACIHGLYSAFFTGMAADIVGDTCGSGGCRNLSGSGGTENVFDSNARIEGLINSNGDPKGVNGSLEVSLFFCA